MNAESRCRTTPNTEGGDGEAWPHSFKAAGLGNLVFQCIVNISGAGLEKSIVNDSSLTTKGPGWDVLEKRPGQARTAHHLTTKSPSNSNVILGGNDGQGGLWGLGVEAHRQTMTISRARTGNNPSYQRFSSVLPTCLESVGQHALQTSARSSITPARARNIMA